MPFPRTDPVGDVTRDSLTRHPRTAGEGQVVAKALRDPARWCGDCQLQADHGHPAADRDIRAWIIVAGPFLTSARSGFRRVVARRIGSFDLYNLSI